MNLFFARSTTPANAKRSHRKRATHEGRRPTLLTKLLAVLAAAFAMQGLVAMTAAHAVQAPVGQGFTVTPGDLAFILRQIKIAEEHSKTLTASNPCGTLVAQPGDNIPDNLQIPDYLTAYGLRTVDGSCNNLVPGRERFTAADEQFPRLTTPDFRAAEGVGAGFFGPGSPAIPSSSYAQKKGSVFDSQPRTVSNLIVDQTSTNPAAVAAAGFPVRAQAAATGVFACSEPPAATDPADCVPPHKTLFMENVTTDVGLSPPYNSLFTFFGQFFDHGVDQTVKTGATSFVPLRADDPLITLGPDGVANSGDEVQPQNAFMVLTRTEVLPGPDGVLGTSDDGATNTDTPWVDQSQTYTSHASHQVFLREYATVGGKPVATGKLLSGLAAGLTYAGSPDGTLGIGTWAAVKQQAAQKLGLQLVDSDVTNIPMLAVDPYGNFFPGPNGFPQYATASGLVEGNPAANGGLGVPVPADVLHFNTPFVGDIAHNADPSPQDTDHNPGTPPVAPVPDADNTPSADFAHQPAGTYDNELLDAHFSCGDGRCNENIALSTVHQIFHSEHDRLVDDISNTLHLPANAALLADFQNVNPTSTDPETKTFTLGERYFQAARFVTEMEYQHLVFEEFARKIQPAVRPFHLYHTDINAAIPAEFAHAVYRFGHSMLDDTVARKTVDPVTGAATDRSLSLLTAFPTPPMFFNTTADTLGNPNGSTWNAEQAAGAIVMGSADQSGNELDEFVTETLRNNLLGLPLDLPTINMTRAREAGVPPLNNLRRQIFAKTGDSQLAPYTDWSDFGQHLKHPESLINFVAAYGLHPTIRDSGPDGILVDDPNAQVDESADNVTTLTAKRNAARAIVDPLTTDPVI